MWLRSGHKLPRPQGAKTGRLVREAMKSERVSPRRSANGAKLSRSRNPIPWAERYVWTMTVFSYHQLTAGRTGDLAEARSRAEAALAGLRGVLARNARNGSDDDD